MGRFRSYSFTFNTHKLHRGAGESLRLSHAFQSFHLTAARKRLFIYESVALHSCGEANPKPQCLYNMGRYRSLKRRSIFNQNF